jgi:hypothetical protein
MKRRRFWIVFALATAVPLFGQSTGVSTGDSSSSMRAVVEKDSRIHRHTQKAPRPIRLKFNMQGLDSALKGLDTLLAHLPIPDEIQIDDRDIRFHAPNMPGFLSFEPPKKTEREGIVKFGSDVVIGRNELVQGNVVVFGGNATVYGEVEGGVVTVKGDIKLASTSRIDGDIVCLWGNADVEEGAAAGKTTVLNFGRMFQKFFSRKPPAGWAVLIDFFRILFVLAIAVLTVCAFPVQTRTVTERVRKHYAKSMAVGALGILLAPIVFLTLCITIIGIPVALFLPVLIIVGFLMGGAAVGFRVGQLAGEKLKMNWKSPVILVCAGILLIECVSFFNKLASAASPFLGKVLFLFSILIFVCTWVPGFGAVIMTRFGTRPKADAAGTEKKRVKSKTE